MSDEQVSRTEHLPDGDINNNNRKRHRRDDYNFAIYQGGDGRDCESGRINAPTLHQTAIPRRPHSRIASANQRSGRGGHHIGISRISQLNDLGSIREHEFTGVGRDGRRPERWYDWWPLTYRLLTCCFPAWMLRICGGMPDERVQRAWREKVALCMIIVVLCAALGFLTFGLSLWVCRPPKTPIYRLRMVEKAPIYNAPTRYKPYKHKGGLDPYGKYVNRDISVYFPVKSAACVRAGVPGRILQCRLPGEKVTHCHGDGLMKHLEAIGTVAFDWNDIYKSHRTVVNGEVYDLTAYLDQNRRPSSSSKQLAMPPLGRRVDMALRRSVGRDGTKALLGFSPQMRTCLRDQFRVGYLEVKTFGCLVTDVVLYVSLVCILGLVMAKFFLAVTFSFLMGRRLGRPTEGPSRLSGKEEPGGGMISSFRPVRYANAMRRDSTLMDNSLRRDGSSAALMQHGKPATNPSQPAAALLKDSTNSPDHMYTIILVTCYSEDQEGLRTTLESLVLCEYDPSQLLLLIIADGIIRGSGNTASTPDLLLGLLELCHERFEAFHFDPDGRPEAYSYVAIADGDRRHNKARVYAGHYRSITDPTRTIQAILVVKVGSGDGGGSFVENSLTVAKPGNRGKRDSQIILMGFLSKCLFDDRMSPLEYDLFFKIYRLTGIPPDHYEAVLMVDADTKVMPTALAKLTAVLRADPLVMGLCGETRIANKMASWVSAIQVFEYYISHHSSKAFESIFGGVTCLPGCFCMYRIKAPKAGGFWVPIVASPDIIDAYAENITETLHRKNLLLLGEDRYLTTLMLKTFPKRKLLFVPQAICKTVVPDSFGVLLSQRRRWINSTVHNLFELVLVPDLCGTFCCSMQFVVFMELVGTLVLPAAICFTGILIASTFIGEPQWIPLFLLAAILGLPALLILFTTLNLLYLFWFLVYIVALPIWNFVLPVYAFWHMDDFSWGETRKVEGSSAKADRQGHDHGGDGKDPAADTPFITMRRWHEFEQERLQKTQQWLGSGGGWGPSHDPASPAALVDPIQHAAMCKAMQEAQEAEEMRQLALQEAEAQRILDAQEMGYYDFGSSIYHSEATAHDQSPLSHPRSAGSAMTSDRIIIASTNVTREASPRSLPEGGLLDPQQERTQKKRQSLLSRLFSKR